MDANSEQLQLKKLLVDLEDEYEHLQASINHLHNEIEKREIEVNKLLADRDLSKLTQEQTYQPQSKLIKSQSVDFNRIQQQQQQQQHQQLNLGGDSLEVYSSDFSKQVDQLLDKITRTCEEVSGLIKL